MSIDVGVARMLVYMDGDGVGGGRGLLGLMDIWQILIVKRIGIK